MTKAYRGISRLDTIPLWNGNNFSPLEIPERLLKLLDCPQDKLPSIHVAGTNGKGSVCSYLSAMLRASGCQVGQFASPHLTHVTERCLINGSPVATCDFDAAVSLVLDLSDRESLSPSYFVIGAVASFYEFARRSLDWMVIEVGLGGLYDATNLIKAPQACVITSIGFGHAHLLGETLAEIAGNKAGIIKPGVPVFVGEVPEEAEETIRRVAREKNSPIWVMGKDFLYDDLHRTLQLGSLELRLPDEPALLHAAYQRRNAALCAFTAYHLGLSTEAINQGFQTARWPGRVEEFLVSRSAREDVQIPVVIDAAHNPAGVQAFCGYLEHRLAESSEVDELIFVISCLRRKNWREMISCFRDFSLRIPAKCSWIFTSFRDPHVLDPEELSALVPASMVVRDSREALRAALATTSARSLIGVSGSIFLLGEVRPLLTGEGFSSMVPASQGRT